MTKDAVIDYPGFMDSVIAIAFTRFAKVDSAVDGVTGQPLVGRAAKVVTLLERCLLANVVGTAGESPAVPEVAFVHRTADMVFGVVSRFAASMIVQWAKGCVPTAGVVAAARLSGG